MFCLGIKIYFRKVDFCQHESQLARCTQVLKFISDVILDTLYLKLSLFLRCTWSGKILNKLTGK